MGGSLEKPQNYWSTYNLTASETVIKLLKELNEINCLIPSGSVIKLKFIIGNNFDELRQKHLKTLEQKLKLKTVVILIAADEDKEHHIYWKSKDINQLLTLKDFDLNSSVNDRFLFEYVAEFLAKSLRNGHLGTHIDFDIIKNQYEAELHHIVDSRNYNLFFLASESGNARPIEALLKYGLESQLIEGKITAQDLALQGGYSDVLLKQLQGNLPFPLEMNSIELSEDLQNFINMCEDVHTFIKSRDEGRLKEVLLQNPNIKYFYNLENESVLKTAATSGTPKIYKFLIERNYNFAPHEDTEEIFRTLNITDREDLHKVHIKCCKDLPEKHLNILIHNTTVTHDDTDESSRLELVRRAYWTLNKDPRLKIILQIVAAVKQFRIIFDFCRDSTFTIDPTTSKNTTGIFYFTGRILIAAKQLLDPKTERETFGALAHELCHFAIYEVYENKSNPFRKSDREAEKKFRAILDICKLNKTKDKIIQNVYDCYDANAQLSELAVRPAHLIAMHHDQSKILKQKVKHYSELFDFFETKIVPEMNSMLPKIDAKLALMPAWNFSDLSDQRKIEVKNVIVIYKNVRVKIGDLFPGNSNVFEKLTSNHIYQLLNKKMLNFNDPQFRYLEDQINFKWQDLAKNLKDELLFSKFKFQGQIIKFRDLHDSCPRAFHSLTSHQIISILSKIEMKIGEEVKPENQFYVDRKFIPEDARLIDFEYQYGSKYIDNYENRERHKKQRMENKTLETFSKAFMKKNFTEISSILDESKANPHFKTCYFDLCQKGYDFMHKSSTELIEQAKNDKILILSSEAGAGKTLTFEHLAIECKKRCSNKWVSYIDLNSFTSLYKAEGNSINVETLLKNQGSRRL